MLKVLGAWQKLQLRVDPSWPSRLAQGYSHPALPRPSQHLHWVEPHLDFLCGSGNSSPESRVPLTGVESGVEEGGVGRGDKGGVSGSPCFSESRRRRQRGAHGPPPELWNPEKELALGRTQGTMAPREGRARWEESPHS